MDAIAKTIIESATDIFGAYRKLAIRCTILFPKERGKLENIYFAQARSKA